MPAPLLVAHGVSKSIDNEVLLEPTDLEIAPGECVAILGENGAGKTTLLRILAGQLLPTTGEARFGGEIADERSTAVRASVATLIGVPAFYPDLTVREQLNLINATWGTAPEESDARTTDTLERFGIDHLRNRFPHELSSGQTQMFQLAATFIRPAQLLILDEPEQRLDPSRKSQLVEAMKHAREGGAAIVFTSHDADVVRRIADRSLTLRDEE